jgi:DNA-binding IclR family transcriptional regulator
MDDDVIAALGGVLEVLWRSAAERPERACTLARLARQAQCPMSVLRRQLTVLEDAGLVALALEEGGVAGKVALTAAGMALAQQLFP